ncbi:MAG: hypothetical protein AAGE52_20045 [Myxococcota bacterium]
MEIESAEEVHAAVCRGALRGLESPLESLAARTDSVAKAWTAAIAAARHLVDADAGPAPTADDLRVFVSQELAERRAALFACAHLQRAALVSWDRASLTSLRALMESLATDVPEAPRYLARADAWIRLLGGDVEGLEEAGKELYSRGSASQDASLVIDATLLRAMGSLTDRDHESAKSLARRASRMARTEGLRAERFLASIVLARVRRRGGRPHLATRILSSIGPLAPPVFQGWLRWERVIAGWRPGATQESAQGTGLSADAAEALVRWVTSASQGDRAAFDKARDDVAAAVAGFADIAQETHALAGALDPDIDVDELPPVVKPWARGSDDDTPAGLHGIVGPPDGPADSTIASVVCRPGERPRRILRVAVPLLPSDVVRLARTRLRRGRVDTAIAALALAGDAGLADAELFEKAYEFEFVSALHAGILDVLVHRMRARIDKAAAVHRKSGRMQLEPSGVLVLPDPRCVEHVEDRLLRVIARHGGVTTRQAAQELDVSVRTAQLALRRLLASGDCVLNRDGRRVQYSVEDTTFTEPTQV